MGGDQQMRNCLVFVVLFCSLVYSSYSYQFVVGGTDGWVVKPSENYIQWASRMRFQVNDTLLFKYKSGSDSVLVVDKGDYDSCTVTNPLLKLDDGNSIFKFNRSGPFYFISGNKANCDQGQKLIVVVLAVRTPPSPLPPQESSPPSPSPAGAPAGSPLSPAHPGGAPAPANLPLAPSPSSGAPSPAGSGSGLGPAPAGALPGSPSSSSMGPGAPGSSMPGAPGSSAPGSGTPADANSPPRSLAEPQCSTSVFSVLSLLLSVGLGVFVF